MEKTIVLYNEKNNSTTSFLQQIRSTILNNCPNCTLINIDDEELSEENIDDLRKKINKKFALIIAIGHTGTFLRAMFLDNCRTPLLAASSEKISFFTELTPNNLQEVIPSLLASNNLQVDLFERIEVIDEKKEKPFQAVNEIALFPKDSAVLMHYTLTINDDVVYRGRADGIVISTALGSTGYALSSGGPIILGNPAVLTIVPINPMNKEHHPLVVPLSSKIMFSNLSSRSKIQAIIDGQLRVNISDNIKIKKTLQPTQIVRFNNKKNILVKLRNRLVELDLRNLEGVPPSARYIFKLLLTEGEQTQKELCDSTGLSNRTVRNALKVLKEKNIINQKPYLKDARQSVYFVL